ncbi:MAG: hypothetical protein ABJG14_21860 [Sulfitobacter sp.]|uniref:hypothetical protein n=1 Tax=Alphaproteobacteria TaxID=28211 RepID=UPI003263E1CF
MPAARGGARKGAGRPKGSRSAATKEQIKTISELAKDHAPAALKALVQVATRGKSEAARVSAASAILDRGYGKPSQSHEVTGKDGKPISHDMKVTAKVVMVPPKDESVVEVKKIPKGEGE